MKDFRCRVCGDPYLGEDAPTNCPFCGAPQKYIVPAEKWKDEYKKVELTDASMHKLDRALDLETKASSFYKAASEIGSDEVVKAMFAALGNIEAEHAKILSKILKIVEPLVIEPDPSACKETEKENLKLALKGEQEAVAFYKEVIEKAEEKMVKVLFTALTETENGHIELIKEKIK